MEAKTDEPCLTETEQAELSALGNVIAQQRAAAEPYEPQDRKPGFEEHLRDIAKRWQMEPLPPEEYERRERERMEYIRQKEARERQQAIRVFCNDAGAGRADGWTFSSWLVGNDKNAQYRANVKSMVEEWSKTYLERRQSHEGLLLYGPCGTGKDHLAFAAVRRVMHEHGVSAKWVNGRDLAGEVRDLIGKDRPEKQFIDGYVYPQILVLSDPQPPFGDLTAYQADVLYRIINARYMARRLTVCTANFASDDEADSRLGVATWDRLKHGAWEAFCSWPSYRRPSRTVKG